MTKLQKMPEKDTILAFIEKAAGTVPPGTFFSANDNILSIPAKNGSFLSFFLSYIGGKRIVFYDTEDDAILYREELRFFTGKDIPLFPVYANRVFERDDEVKRAGFLTRLLEDTDFIGLFPVSALRHNLPAVDTMKEGIRAIHFGDVVYREDLIGFLEKTGYELAPLVREQGQYARRGSIIDVFPSSHEKPLRIEFLGDEILSLRFFDPISQRSEKEVEMASLVPFSFDAEETAVSILDYLGNDMTFVHSGFETLLAAAEGIGEESFREHLAEVVGRSFQINISGILEGKGEKSAEVVSNADLRLLFDTRKTEIFSTLVQKLRDQWNRCPYIYFAAQNARHAERLAEIFKTYDVNLPVVHAISFEKKDREWAVLVCPIRRGFRTDRVILVTEEDITGPKKRVVKQRWDGFDEFLNSFKDLRVGEYVVHIEHGIGIYRGITELAIAGSRKDFLVIEYLEGDKLYVPVENLHLVQKYIAGEKHTPKIERLSSQLWKNTKRKVKKYVEDIAQELLQLYAERQMQEGHAYPPEDELYRDMEARFEYEETDGQLRAIDEVLADLKDIKPMDRLICGDVGFGKTEVAMRAAFKVVMDNKQVVILVPTTILAQQHFKNFSERFRDYPVTVEMLSRFRTKAEQAPVLEGLKKGVVDIVIGTHALLRKDLAVRDLGLIIIDEEHRFGVVHKEKLKHLRKNVDILTMSATPIPRTLHMAMTGIKDLSIISTPPLDRLAVKTMVVKFNDGIIQKGITEELDRGGQVFFVHNFVHNIGVVHDYLTKLLPGVGIAVAHGQMDGRRLERVMLDFINKKYAVLLSTNIIESGLDISNVNTIFINNAHRLGLADLYQLRGRVGRSSKQAYAYMLVPKDEVLTRDAALRLKIIDELTELGSGFHVANYDLEIRGAGNLLGKEQSGSVNLVGFELYCNMLNDAVSALKNKSVPVETEIVPEINIPVDAFIPDTYVDDSAQKLLTYKRLARIRDDGELADFRDELQDRYGNLPQPLVNLLDIIALRIVLARYYIRRLEYGQKRVVIHVTDRTPLDMARLLQLVKEKGSSVKLLPDGKIVLHADRRPEELLRLTRNVLMEIIPL